MKEGKEEWSEGRHACVNVESTVLGCEGKYVPCRWPCCLGELAVVPGCGPELSPRRPTWGADSKWVKVDMTQEYNCRTA